MRTQGQNRRQHRHSVDMRLVGLFICAICVIGGFSRIACAQNVRFVRASAAPGGNGLSWNTAYNDLQVALNSILANPAVTQLWIAAGTYKPAAAGGARTATFALRNNLALYGGFNGTESAFTQRNIALNVTTLSGDLLNDDQAAAISSVPPWLADNAYHVVTASGVNSTARLDGLTIRGGAATDASSPNNGGGGLNCVGGSPTIDRCTFIRNFALHRGGAACLSAASNSAITFCTFTSNQTFDDANADDGGGAMHIASSNPTVSDCTFTTNRAIGAGQFAGGGAIRNVGGGPTITRCAFTSNRHNNYGGAIDNRNGNPIISRCSFDLNQSEYGGGVRSGGGSVTVTECEFREGFGVGIGDGVYLVGGTHLVSRCLFDRTHAGDGGGAMAMSDGASASVVNCRFFGCEVDIFGGGAIWNLDTASTSANLTVINSVFSGNRCTGSGARGGAILTNSAASTVLANCTFVNNALDTGATSGGAVHNTGSGIAVVHNCILVHNTPVALGNTGSGSINVRYSCVEGGAAGPGNIASSNPGFADENGPDNLIGTPDDDLRLIASSVCIDAARNADVPEDVADLDGDSNIVEQTPLDLALRARFYDLASAPDTGSGTAPIVDMGAFEYHLPCPADIAPGAGNGVVDLNDLLTVISSWGPCVGCPPSHCPADIAPINSGGDCAVNVADLLAVITSWGACP